MATIQVGHVLTTPEEYEALKHAAAKLPDDWTVQAVGSTTTGIFSVYVKDPAGRSAYKSFPSDGAPEAVLFLRALASGVIGLVSPEK